MSRENELTLYVYQDAADRYLQNSIVHDTIYAEKTKQKQDVLRELLRVGFATLPPHSTILEIGSGDGNTASYLEALGFDVTASDVADSFITAIRAKQLKAIKFDVLKDRYPGRYHGVVCWRVFVHFTSADAKKMLVKTYASLVKGGRLIFNAMNREGYAENEEWLDFQGTYHMGAKRYFHYFDEAELREMVVSAGFQIVSFRREGGDNGNKWLTFILEK